MIQLTLLSYKTIVSKICGDSQHPNYQRVIRILQWMLVAKRPVKRYEVEDGIVLDGKIREITETTKVRGDILSLCSPFLVVDTGPEGHVRFVHFTAQEYVDEISNIFNQIRNICLLTSF